MLLSRPFTLSTPALLLPSSLHLHSCLSESHSRMCRFKYTFKDVWASYNFEAVGQLHARLCAHWGSHLIMRYICVWRSIRPLWVYHLLPPVASLLLLRLLLSPVLQTLCALSPPRTIRCSWLRSSLHYFIPGGWLIGAPWCSSLSGLP